MRAILLIAVFLLAGCQSADMSKITCRNLQYSQQRAAADYIADRWPGNAPPDKYLSLVELACGIDPDRTIEDAVTFAVSLSRLDATGQTVSAKAE